jgi:hypothetical protein
MVFLGFANFYRRFIEGYSKIAAPMLEVTKGRSTKKKSRDKNIEPFQLTLAAKDAFEALKSKFLSAPVLAHFDPARRTRLEVDVLGFAIAGICT